MFRAAYCLRETGDRVHLLPWRDVLWIYCWVEFTEYDIWGKYKIYRDMQTELCECRVVQLQNEGISVLEVLPWDGGV